MINAPTWVIHAVFADDEEIDTYGEYFGNIHTHGLNEYGHCELCIPFWVQKELAGVILNNIGMQIANENKEYKEGLIEDELQGGYNLKAIRFEDDPTLYILLPDRENRFYDDPACDPEYARQYGYAKHISEEKAYV